VKENAVKKPDQPSNDKKELAKEEKKGKQQS